MTTPRYEYSRTQIQQRIDELMQLSLPFGNTIRYAVKANPHPEIIAMMKSSGVKFDASSSYEASELIAMGVAASDISLSSQQTSHNLEELLGAGVRFVATSRKQFQSFIDCANRPHSVAIRINPGVGSGHNNRTSTGGRNAAFGIWHEYIPDILEMAEKATIKIDTVHIHVGSGADPNVWSSVLETSLKVVERIPDCTVLDIGGGFKVHRYGDEKEADMATIFKHFSERLTDFAESTGRKLHLEIEPGTYFIAHAGTLVAEIDDIVDTGHDGYNFIRLNTGMNDFLRSSMYGARHTIEVINDSSEKLDYIVVGHNCESGDILTTQAGDPESIEPRLLNKASIGDEVRIYDTGAYCASMRAKGYNSFPDAEEIFVD